MELRSDQIKRGVARAPHRSLLKADGLTDEELERPLRRGVSSAQNDVIPGHMPPAEHRRGREGRHAAWPAAFRCEISTIGVCDGIAMNHEGMHYSLAIAARSSLTASNAPCRATPFDGHGAHSRTCDKIVPGMLIGRAAG